jgi:hypothetical protein
MSGLRGEQGAGAVTRHIVGQKADFGERLIQRLFRRLKALRDEVGEVGLVIHGEDLG